MWLGLRPPWCSVVWCSAAFVFRVAVWFGFGPFLCVVVCGSAFVSVCVLWIGIQQCLWFFRLWLRLRLVLGFVPPPPPPLGLSMRATAGSTSGGKSHMRAKCQGRARSMLCVVYCFFSMASGRLRVVSYASEAGVRPGRGALAHLSRRRQIENEYNCKFVW